MRLDLNNWWKEETRAYNFHLLDMVPSYPLLKSQNNFLFYSWVPSAPDSCVKLVNNIISEKKASIIGSNCGQIFCYRLPFTPDNGAPFEVFPVSVLSTIVAKKKFCFETSSPSVSEHHKS